MSYAISSLDELGEGYGFRKVRRALGVTAFGVNAVVMPPGYEGFLHYHDTQDELYFVHSGTARFEVGDEVRELGPGQPRPRRVDDAAEVLERGRRRPRRPRRRRARTATSSATGTSSTRIATWSGGRRSGRRPTGPPG